MVRNQIEAIVSQLTGNSAFAYGTEAELNALADDIKYREAGKYSAFLYQLQPITMSLGKNGSVPRSYDLYLTFLQLTEFEKNTADNELIVQSMETKAAEFLLRAQDYRESETAERFFKFADNFTARAVPVYWNKDVNLTGVSLSFRVDKRSEDIGPLC